MATSTTPLGIDLFSIRSSGYSPFEYLDYSARLGAKVVHFSEARFLGNVDDAAHLRKVKEHADKLGVAIEAGMSSICETSKRFDRSKGSAAQQLGRMIGAARALGSPIVRCFLGAAEDRPPERHFDGIVATLRSVRSLATDNQVKIAIENHAGDMQGRELKQLIEAAGKEFVGAVVDSGNPLWTLEDPHETLEVLAPYVLTSHVRDSAVWRTPKGIAVAWTRMGEGNVGIDQWVARYRQLCPGKALSMEIICIPPREYAIYDPAFWNNYKGIPAWSFARFLAIAEQGKPFSYQASSKEEQAARERADLEASVAYTKRLLA